MIGRELAGGSGIDDMSIMEVLGRHPTNSDGAERFGGVAASWSMAGADLQRMAAAYLTDPTNEFTLTDVKFPGPPGLAD